ncbi:MAG: hypothetical protein FWC40_02940 [Proteobacteria bacterium]|nr:hypothetical protein [Pseudomonadota bacterium]
MTKHHTTEHSAEIASKPSCRGDFLTDALMMGTHSLPRIWIFIARTNILGAGFMAFNAFAILAIIIIAFSDTKQLSLFYFATAAISYGLLFILCHSAYDVAWWRAIADKSPAARQRPWLDDLPSVLLINLCAYAMGLILLMLAGVFAAALVLHQTPEAALGLGLFFLLLPTLLGMRRHIIAERITSGRSLGASIQYAIHAWWSRPLRFYALTGLSLLGWAAFLILMRAVDVAAAARDLAQHPLIGFWVFWAGCLFAVFLYAVPAFWLTASYRNRASEAAASLLAKGKGKTETAHCPLAE